MEQNELYAELKEYIFEYCSEYFREKEKNAHKHLHALAKSNNDVNAFAYKFIMKQENFIDNKEVNELIGGGYEAFKEKVVARIWKEHKEKLELNLCPLCKKIARTPNAKQCRFCFHDWH